MAAGDGYRLYVAATGEGAAFCRLEHVVPWELGGGRWREVAEIPSEIAKPRECAECGAGLGDDALILVRHREAHRIPDGFCSEAHLGAWAKAGGRWR